MGNYISHFVQVPQFTIDDVPAVTFGGFLMDKYICSQPNATPSEGSPDVAHSGAAGSVPAISKPGVPVWDFINFPQAMIACANRGKGWHLTTAFEWASLMFLSKKFGTYPHGNNSNSNPPADTTYTSEIGLLDKHLNGENATYYRALPGTGPSAWAHNHLGLGIYDLNGLVWEWVMMFMTTDGYPRVPANLDVSYTGSPYGRGTISGSGGATPTLTCDGSGVNWLKNWTADEFNGIKVYIAETGALYDITDTTPTTVVLTNGDAPGDGTATFFICKTISTDITSGMTSGNKILTLRDSDADLKAFGIPATSDATGAAAYGNDSFCYDKSAERAARRGGGFSYGSAGVCALYLNYSPSDSYCSGGVRACKAL